MPPAALWSDRRLLGQHPVDGALADAQPPRYFGLAQAIGRKLADLVSFASRGWRPALVLAFRLRRGNPLALPLKHDLALEFGDRSDDVEEQSASGRAGIDAHIDDFQR